MIRHAIVWLSLIGTALVRASAHASDDVHPWQDDAALHAVQFVGSRHGWAVGDRGVVWRTEDGGRSWALTKTPTDASLYGVCFLTNQFGWAVGSGTQPYTGLGFGVILKTTDGGRTWIDVRAKSSQPKTFRKKTSTAVVLDQPQSTDHFPPLRAIKFFGVDEGVAVGEASAAFPTGCLMTSDGGETWVPQKGDVSLGWQGADFREAEHGILVGERGRIALSNDFEVLRSRNDRRSLRGVRAVKFAEGLTAWAVGDGGLVLKSSNGGVSWESPSQALPIEVGVFTDFRAVATRGNSVWIAGSPGGRVWHSADDGLSWTAQPTGESQPMNALTFLSEQVGVAVGAFGTILRTEDGGASWAPVRGGSRRAAVLSWHARPERMPFNALTKYAGENGYRAVSLIVPRWESLDRDRDAAGPIERRANDALLAVGGHSAEVGWRLPVTLPEVDRSVDRLTEEWQKHTEGRMVEIVMSDFVAQLRQWRPSIVVLDRPAEDDAVGKLVFSAAQRAISAAADPTRYPEHEQLGGLGPWRVERVCVQVSSKDSAKVVIDPFEPLPRLKTIVHEFATAGRSMLFPTIQRAPQRECFELDLSPDTSESSDYKNSVIQLTGAREFWTGISLPTNSDARRALLSMSETEIEKQRELAIRQRNFRGIVDRHLDQPDRAAQLLAELRGAVQGLPKSQAVLQLVQLADDHRRRGQWELAEATQIEIINRYPDEPAAAESMLWLLRFWSSEEMSWQRSRQVGLQAGQVTTDRTALLNKLQQLVESAGQQLDDPLAVARATAPDLKNDVTTLSALPSQDSAHWRQQAEQVWLRQAVQLARLIRQRNRTLFDTPQVQFPLASALRRSGMNTVLMQLAQDDPTSPLTELISKETLLTQAGTEQPPTQFATCARAMSRPQLDGILSDDCWRAAKEIRLVADSRTPTEFNGSYSFVLLTYDNQFLYVAANIPRVDGLPTDGPQYPGRKHDADLKGFDRLTFALDVNRDFATSYQIHIDQRGQVAEQCWEDASWNPKLFVAVDAEDARWRLEMAIPFQELTSAVPNGTTNWAVSITRTIPLTSTEAWPARKEVTAQVEPGILRFR